VEIILEKKCPQCGGDHILLVCYTPPTMQYRCADVRCNQNFAEINVPFPLELKGSAWRDHEVEALKKELAELKLQFDMR
jgi:hypothetical protein